MIDTADAIVIGSGGRDRIPPGAARGPSRRAARQARPSPIVGCSLRRAAVVWARAQAPSSLAVPALLRRGL